MADIKDISADFIPTGHFDDLIDPAFSYVILHGGSGNDRARLRQAIRKRGISILEEKTMSLSEHPDDTIVLKLPGANRSSLLLELAEEGIGGVLSAYGKGP